MRKLFCFFLCFFCSNLYAESQVLAPVVDNSIYRNGRANRQIQKPSDNAMYEMFGRLEQLQREVQQLRGLVEEQTQVMSELKNRQNNIYSDLDMRIQGLSGTTSGIGGSAGVVAGNQIQRTKANTDITQNSISKKQQLNANDTVSIAKTTPGMDKTAEKEPVANQKELYQAAYGMLRNGHNSQAISEFKRLLVDYPDGKFASNSQYWLGEAYKVTKDVDSAKRAFAKVVSHYGRSPKVPDALLKLGYIELEQKNKISARDYLTQITVRFPNSTAAHLAKKKLLQIENN